jgi:hypothetical protein
MDAAGVFKRGPPQLCSGTPSPSRLAETLGTGAIGFGAATGTCVEAADDRAAGVAVRWGEEASVLMLAACALPAISAQNAIGTTDATNLSLRFVDVLSVCTMPTILVFHPNQTAVVSAAICVAPVDPASDCTLKGKF